MTIIVTATIALSFVYTVAAFIKFATNEIKARRFSIEVDRMELPEIDYPQDLSWAIATDEELEPDTEDDMEAIAIEVDRVNYASLTTEELRKVCATAGIVWRNAHGKGKHLKKGEMLAALI